MVCGWMILLQSMHSLCSSLTSCHVMGPLGEFIQCPNLSEGNLGFAGGLFFQLGKLGEPTGPVAEVMGGSCGLVFQNTLCSFCVEFGNMWKGVVLLSLQRIPSSPAVISQGKRGNFHNGEVGECGVSTATP